MTNILIKNLDVTDFFINDDLNKIAEISENLSENSKVVDIPLSDDYKQKKDTDFAVVLLSHKNENYPKYAMYNSGVTELNLAFLSSLADEIPEEVVKVAAANLTASAKHYNLAIPDNLKKYASDSYINRYVHLKDINEAGFITKLSNHKSQPKNNEVFALKNYYPITTQSDLEKSAAWFDRNYTKLDIDEQQEFIENVNKQQEKLNIKTASIINDFNNLDKEKFNDEFKLHLNIRKSYLTDDDDNAQVFDDLWAQKNEIGPYKTAYVLEAIDKELQLNNLYGDKIADPLRATLGKISKVASVQVGDKEVTFNALSKISNVDLGAIVGEGFVSEIKADENLIVFDSLPDPMKREITELL